MTLADAATYWPLLSLPALWTVAHVVRKRRNRAVTRRDTWLHNHERGDKT